MARIVILGAGLTGISTAYHLEQQKFFDYALFEKEESAGGLCRSLTENGFTFDYTGHLLHASDDYFYSLIQKLVGLDALNVIDRRSFIYSHDTYTHYPFQINLHGLPPRVIIECIEAYVARPSIANPQTFREWVTTTFGTGFGNHFFFPYQQKIFACDIDELTASWTGRFVPQTSLKEILHGSLHDNPPSVGYNARFLYPKKGGIHFWVQKLADQLIKPIQTEHTVTSIDANKKIVHFANGHAEPYEQLVSTLPLDTMLTFLKETSTMRVANAARHLQSSKVVTFNLGTNKPDLSDKHWIYFPENKYPFYRVGFWHNFSDQMAPPGHSSLYGEFAYRNASDDWIKKTTQQSIAQVKQLFALSDEQIVAQKIFTIPHAYVTYDQWREKNLSSILSQLQDASILSVGRYGAWKYASMQEAVLDGKDTADLCFKNETKTVSPKALQKPIREISAHE